MTEAPNETAQNLPRIGCCCEGPVARQHQEHARHRG